MVDATGLSDPQSPGSAPAAQKVSRAVLRPIEAGSYVDCAACGDRVKFQAKTRLMQVICNVYTDVRLYRVEHYH
ncbi:MAG: hypothetical protein IT196_17620 [Acidimicrobiales bacterium]|nr:hypothetical protein [Acidimicrobiales bacterium]